ncbi:hypothetical protein [Shewanella sp. MBTL60-007]|uniref:hypothetical protein n=1 Tax=Shewanella sp. MBTL60-007 TaxID=2815911 RepID=UPI001BC40592|nr:hypothetical protein [Shewanella sp. MBTL60-007]GIU20787.1 hypothetical protein TUM3792_20780 [Shewanella sp. MBTL60-007]
MDKVIFPIIFAIAVMGSLAYMEYVKAHEAYLNNFPYLIETEQGEFGVELAINEDKKFIGLPNECVWQRVGTKITILKNENIIQIDASEDAKDAGCKPRMFLAANSERDEVAKAFLLAFNAPKRESDLSLEFEPINSGSSIEAETHGNTN